MPVPVVPVVPAVPEEGGGGGEITLEHGNGLALVKISGRLDRSGADTLRDLLRDGTREPAVVVDMADVTGIDAGGLGALLAGVARAKGRGQHLAVAVSHSFVGAVLAAAGLDSVAPVVASRDQALRWMDAHGWLHRHDLEASPWT